MSPETSPTAEGHPGMASKEPEFPPSNAPRVWLLSDGLLPTAVALSRRLLEHGDCVVAGIVPEEFEGPRGDALRSLMQEKDGVHNWTQDEAGSHHMTEGRWKDKLRIAHLNGRHAGQVQAGIAEAVALFGEIDVLLICNSEVLVGTVEELSQNARSRSLILDQFEGNFFSAVNVIKAVLPLMREKRNGHIIVLTGITAHLGTPGLGMYCSSQWALEGYCDSLAYEIAPFNIKLTIVQPNMEIGVFTNKITTVPAMSEYQPRRNHAPLAREIFGRLLQSIGSSDDEIDVSRQLNSTNITSLYPPLPQAMLEKLVSETVFSLAAIGGHDNPPARLIVGFEGIASVKEKLKTVSEELEDFIEVSEQVDIPRESGKGDGQNTGDDGHSGDKGDDDSAHEDREDLDMDLKF